MAEEKKTDPVDVDSLAGKLMAAFGRRRAGSDDEDDEGGGEKRVPVERLRREIDRRKVVEKEIESLRADVAALVEGRKKELGDLRTATAAEVKGIAARHAEDLQLVDLGMTDPLGRQTLRAAWEGMPKEGRGETPVAWWTTQIAAAKAHAEKPKEIKAPDVPRALTPYLPAASAAGKPGEAGGKGAPPTNAAPGKGGDDFASFDPAKGIQGWVSHLAGLKLPPAGQG